MRRPLSTRSVGLLAALLTLTTLPGRADSVPRAQALDGRQVELFDAAGHAATVLIFTATDCPISNRYAPVLNRLQAHFAADDVRFVLVYANPADAPESIRAHLAKFGYRMEAVRDPDQQVAAFTGVTIAPEAVVFDRAHRQVYRGRIDDRFASVGVERQTVSSRDLEDALSSVIAGRPVRAPVTQAVGCVLADFRR